ncbi:MAG: response regulator [Deltaproteobacteria bacterium]|nr:response regulator [Deltaproteobacteria bacterium]
MDDDGLWNAGIDLAELCDWLSLEVFSVDLERRRVVLVSARLEQRVGRSRAEIAEEELTPEVLERWLGVLFDDEGARARVRNAFEGVVGLSTKLVYRTGDPPTWRRGRVHVISTPSGRRLDFVSQDITDVVESVRAARSAELIRLVNEAIHDAEDVIAGATAAAEIVKQHFGVDRCAIMLFDELRGSLGARGVSGPDVVLPADTAATMLRHFLELHGPRAQFADLSVVPGVQPDLIRAMNLKSFAFSQIGAGKAPVGSLSLATCETRHFQDDEMQLLGHVADALVGPLARKAFYDERKRVQGRMEEAEGRLRAALEASSTGIFELDVARDTFHLDGRCREIFGIEGTEIERASFLARVHPEDLDSMRRAAEGAVAPKSDGAHVQFRYESARGTLWINAHGRLHSGPDGVPRRLIGTVQDVTDSRRLEAKLVATQKLESLGVLAGGIAHDFNNLLVGVLGNAGLAKLELPASSPALSSIEGIETAALRASELTRQLLAYAGKARFVITRIDVRRLVEEMGHLLQAVIGKGVVLRYQFAPSLPSVEGDATQLRQVVMNLITNASDAIGERSGMVTLSTGLLHADRAYLAETLFDEELTPGDYVCLQVSDTGAGMDDETQARIFEPFFTTKFTGRGLGLAAVLGILRSHRGSLKVYSEPGRGTTFKVLLPAADGPPDATSPEAPPPRAQGSGTILVVDDEETVRAVTKRVLERAGFRVLTAMDGLDGLEVFRAHRDEIVAVVLDVTMPRMGGEEAFRQLRLLSPDVRVVLASGYSEQEATSQFAGKGLAGFIEKPFRGSDLVAKVQRALED